MALYISISTTYEVCFLRTWTRKISDVTFFGEVVGKNIFYSALHLQPVLFQPFHPPVSLLATQLVLPFTFLSSPPPIFRHCSDPQFGGLVATARKNFKRFKKMSRRSTATKPWRECRCKRLSKRQRRGKPAVAAADKKHINTEVPLP